MTNIVFESVEFLSGAPGATTKRTPAQRAADIINVKDYGATGNGVTDDTLAIQAAFNSNQLTTTATTTGSSLIVHFSAPLPAWVVAGLPLMDISPPGNAIAQGTFITAVNTSAGTVTMSTTTFNAGVQTGDTIVIGQPGKVFFPAGIYIVSGTIQLPASGSPPTSAGASVQIEGCGGASELLASPAFNGFVFDDYAPTTNHGSAQAWEIKNLYIHNAYVPPKIYRSNVIASASFARGANPPNPLSVTSASSSGILEGAILFDTVFPGGSPAYLGFVAPGGVGAPVGGNTPLTLGDTIGIGGAQVPSTATNDNLFMVQGYYVASGQSWSASAGNVTITGGSYNPATGAVSLTLGTSVNIQVGGPIAVTVTGTGSVSSLSGSFFATAGTSGTTLNYTAATGLTLTITGGTLNQTNIIMNASNPGLDAGNYLVWDWTWVTAARTSVPRCLGVVNAANWVGTTLTLNNIANVTNEGTQDLLVLTPMSGGIRHVSTFYARIEGCLFSAILGIFNDCNNVSQQADGLGDDWFCTIRNCAVAGTAGASAQIGNIGFYSGQSTIYENCDAPSNWNGFRIIAADSTMIGGRAEVNCYSVVIGGIMHNSIVNDGVTGFTLMNFEAEGTWGAGLITDTSSLVGGLITGFTCSGNHSNSCYGIVVTGEGATIANCSVSGDSSAGYGAFWNPSLAGNGTPAGIYVPDSVNPTNTTYLSCFSNVGSPGSQQLPGGTVAGLLGQAWRMPTNPTAARLLNCNNPPPVFTYAKLPQGQAATGQIDNGNGSNNTAGTILNLSAGTFGKTDVLGSAVTGPGVSPGTFITGSQVTGTGQPVTVNNSQLVPAGTAMTVYPMVDGDEYYISDSTIPPMPVFICNGAISTGSPTINMSTAAPAYSVVGLKVFDITNNKSIGTVQSYSGNTLTLTGNASNASAGTSDQLVFSPLTNAGTIITSGGGIYTVKARWAADLANWVMV